MESKAQIREKIINKLKKFDSAAKKKQTDSILAQLTDSSAWRNAEKVALYMATPLEFDLSTLFEQTDKKILIPKCLPKRQMMFAEYKSDKLKRSSYGLLEPDGLPEEIPDFILVPGLAWNTAGYRIGFGGGYYDRYLASFKGKTASILYDFQMLDFTPENHDIAVQHIFTLRMEHENNEF